MHSREPYPWLLLKKYYFSGNTLAIPQCDEILRPERWSKKTTLILKTARLDDTRPGKFSFDNADNLFTIVGSRNCAA